MGGLNSNRGSAQTAFAAVCAIAAVVCGIAFVQPAVAKRHPAAAAKHKAHLCAPRRQIVLATRRVEVFRRQVRSPGVGKHQDTFVCRVSTRRSLAFADRAIPQIIVPRQTVKIAALFAAAYVIEGTGEDVRYSVRVIDLTGSAPRLAFDSYSTPTLREGGTVEDLVLSAQGAVAWIVQASAYGAPASYEVRAAGSTHVQQLLSSNPQIDPHSLALHGSTLTWTESGATHSATLS